MLKQLLITVCFLFTISHLQAQCTFTSNVPYSESFNTFTVNNQLPTCWASSSSVTALTFSGTSGYAAFLANPAGVTYFYTNGVQLYTNVVYSVSILYAVDQPGMNWSSVALLYSASQTSAALNMIANSTVAAVSNTAYAQLTNTFTVPGSGIYNFAIRGVSNATASSQYLKCDDFQVSIPCSVSANQPSLTAVSNPTAVCIGKSATITANGGNTYLWNTGATTKSLVVTPAIGGTLQYSVSSTRTLTSCSVNTVVNLVVNAKPTVVLTAPQANLCAGGTGVLFASGAQTYTFVGLLNLLPIPIQTVSPNSTTTYSVNGSNAAGCVGQGTVTIFVNPSPNVQLSVFPKIACKGEPATLIATGANTYTWAGGLGNGSSITVTPGATTSYTVNGSANGCADNASITVTVQDCSGIPAQQSQDKFALFPNPASQGITIQVPATPATVEIMDITGRLVQLIYADDSRIEVPLNLPSGVYFVKINSAGTQKVIRLVRE